jgi:hypothetical protein
MTMRTIKGALQVAFFGGAFGVLPVPAFAGEAAGQADRPDVPDHTQAEARTGASERVPTVDKTEGALDHEEAEARGAKSAEPPANEQQPGTPDHNRAEARGAETR